MLSKGNSVNKKIKENNAMQVCSVNSVSETETAGYLWFGETTSGEGRWRKKLREDS
jgi:hypothetical protein